MTPRWTRRHATSSCGNQMASQMWCSRLSTACSCYWRSITPSGMRFLESSSPRWRSTRTWEMRPPRRTGGSMPNAWGRWKRMAFTRGYNSTVDDAIRSRQGVCQDFAHTMISIVRNLRIPCRYVSGYLHRDPGHADRSDEGATHAWVDALLPHIGWVGFDPTNNLIVGGRHIRTAIGRDY